MSDRTIHRDEERLKAAVRDGLQARDRAMPAPGFARIWPATASPRPALIFQRPAFAAFASLVLLAGVAFVFLGRHAEEYVSPIEEDAAFLLARELSSPNYWRVPTDELLAFATPPLSAELPLPEGFHVSLEESLL